MIPQNVSQDELIVYNRGEKLLITYVYYECPFCKTFNIFYAEDDIARSIVKNNDGTSETKNRFRSRVQKLKQLVTEELHAKRINESGNREE